MRSLTKKQPCRTLAVFLTQPNLSFYLLFDYAQDLSLGGGHGGFGDLCLESQRRKNHGSRRRVFVYGAESN